MPDIFVRPGDPFLQSVAAEVPVDEIPSAKIQGIIDRMLEIARGERGDVEKRVMVGLAAPQIGVPLQIILVDMGVDSSRKNLGQLEAFINPKITYLSAEGEEGREGCFSVDSHIAGVVRRATEIHIMAYPWTRENPVLQDWDESRLLLLSFPFRYTGLTAGQAETSSSKNPLKFWLSE